MRLTGSFHTITCHGRSATVSGERSGRSSRPVDPPGACSGEAPGGTGSCLHHTMAPFYAATRPVPGGARAAAAGARRACRVADVTEQTPTLDTGWLLPTSLFTDHYELTMLQ